MILPRFGEGGKSTYSGKNNTFFFFSMEQIADSRPRFDVTSGLWAPTDAMKNGDFSAYTNSIKIFDPLTGTFSGGVTTNRTAFTNNIIPANRINPVAKAVVQYLGSTQAGIAESDYSLTIITRFDAG